MDEMTVSKQQLTQIVGRSNKLFGGRSSLVSYWQDVAEHCYVERAHFKGTGTLDPSDFSGHLTSGAGIQARSELANAVSGMLRPPGRVWFRPKMRGIDSEDLDQKIVLQLERIRTIMQNAMYDPLSRFSRATKQADNDYVAFGNAVIGIEINRKRSTLLYRNHHLRDCAWAEGGDGEVDEIYIKIERTCAQLKGERRLSLAPNVQSLSDREMHQKIKCLWVVVPAEQVWGYKHEGKFASLYIDAENEHLMAAEMRDYFGYVVPRWQTVSDSQYGYSPPTVASLPDVRSLQAIMRSLMEAGEKAADPPMAAQQDVVRGDIDLTSGGLTWLDAEYDESLGAAIRPLVQSARGFPFGWQIMEDVRAQVAAAFMLNKLTLPDAGHGDMTAYEVGQRIQEYVRSATPLFEPIQADYNAKLCDETFNVLTAAEAMPAPETLPEEMTDTDIDFSFENPFTAAASQEVAVQYDAVTGLLSRQMQLDPMAVAELDTNIMFRAAVRGLSVPADWLRSEDDAMEQRAVLEQQAKAAQQMAMMREMAETAQAAGAGMSAMGDGAAAMGPEAMMGVEGQPDAA